MEYEIVEWYMFPFGQVLFSNSAFPFLSLIWKEGLYWWQQIGVMIRLRYIEVNTEYWWSPSFTVRPSSDWDKGIDAGRNLAGKNVVVVRAKWWTTYISATFHNPHHILRLSHVLFYLFFRFFSDADLGVLQHGSR